MPIKDETRATLRKLLVPAASLAGAGAGLALTRTRTDKLRGALPTLDDLGVGDLTDDLRSKLSSAVAKLDSGASSLRAGVSTSGPLDSAELEARRRRREARRKQRTGR
jgi:hypothetical protein